MINQNKVLHGEQMKKSIVVKRVTKNLPTSNNISIMTTLLFLSSNTLYLHCHNFEITDPVIIHILRSLRSNASILSPIYDYGCKYDRM